jgi:hypothetical protein
MNNEYQDEFFPHNRQTVHLHANVSRELIIAKISKISEIWTER